MANNIAADSSVEVGPRWELKARWVAVVERARPSYSKSAHMSASSGLTSFPSLWVSLASLTNLMVVVAPAPVQVGVAVAAQKGAGLLSQLAPHAQSC